MLLLIRLKVNVGNLNLFCNIKDNNKKQPKFTK